MVSLEQKEMPSKTKRNYFTKDTELAIIEYLALEDQDKRNKIYKDRIEYGFFKLTQNIIHTFKFYYTDGETIEDIQQEVIEFLLQKLPKYKQEKGMAYSYFGTIAKRYCIIKNKKNYQKLQDRGEIEEVDEDPGIYGQIIREGEDEEVYKFFLLFIDYIDKKLFELFPKSADAQIADAVLELFRKRESLQIFNKKALYIYIREITNAETPQITKIVKKIKSIYTQLFNEYYKHGIIENV